MIVLMRFLALAALALLGACAPEVIAPGPAIARPLLQDDAIIAADGYRLPLRRWLPQQEPKAVILGLHGFGDYSKAFDGPAQYWARHGVATYAYDQRGFGATATARRWSGTAALVDDFRAAVALLRARYPDLPLYVVGESMGGAVVMTAMGEGPRLPVAGTVLVGPAVRGRASLGVVGRNGLWLVAHVMPWWPISTVGMDYAPSDNKAMLEELSRDPLVIKTPRVDLVWGLVNAMDAGQAAAPRQHGPMLILYGRNDRLVPNDVMRAMLKSLPDDPTIRVAVYAKGYHMLLRDLEAHLVQEDVLAWMADKSAALPSGADLAAKAFLSPSE